VAGLWSLNKAGYDFFVIAGVKNNRRIFGGAWAGDIAGAGFRGEFILGDAPGKSRIARSYLSCRIEKLALPRGP
jgi:hypothetical protein